MLKTKRKMSEKDCAFEINMFFFFRSEIKARLRMNDGK